MSKPTTVRFDEDEIRKLERIAKLRGTTISAVVQDAVRAFYLRGDRAAAVDKLLAFVNAHADSEEGDVDEIEARIQERMKGAAHR